MRRIRFPASRAVTALCLSVVCTMALAEQDYPNRVIKIVVPAPPGGELDPVARAIGEQLQADWGQPVIVDNKPGAASIPAAIAVVKSQPDGYTLLLCSTTALALNPSLYGASLPYNVTRDIEPIAPISYAPMVLVARKTLGVNSVAELIDLARKNPGKLNYASSSNGNVTHIAGAYFSRLNKLDMVHVPYKGSAPATLDLLGGQVDLYFNPLPSAMGFLKEGRATPLAVTQAKRSWALPQVPTFEEVGIKNFELTSWYGLCGPAGMPRAIVQKINQGVVKAIGMPVVANRLHALGTDPMPGSPEQFTKFIREQAAKYGELITSNGIKPD